MTCAIVLPEIVKCISYFHDKILNRHYQTCFFIISRKILLNMT